MHKSRAVYQSSAVAMRQRRRPLMLYSTATYKGIPTVCPIWGKMKLISLAIHFVLSPTSYCDSETCGVISRRLLSYRWAFEDYNNIKTLFFYIFIHRTRLYILWVSLFLHSFTTNVLRSHFPAQILLNCSSDFGSPAKKRKRQLQNLTIRLLDEFRSAALPLDK